MAQVFIEFIILEPVYGLPRHENVRTHSAPSYGHHHKCGVN